MPIRSLFIKGVGVLGFSLALILLPGLLMARDALPQAPLDKGREIDLCAQPRIGLVKAKVARLQEAARALRGLASQPAPKGLDYEEAKKTYGYSLWLREANERIDRVGSKGIRILEYCGRYRREDGKAQATAQMQEMQRSFHAQFIQLQNSLSYEHRQFSMVSNIMKNRHDMAKNAIDNIR